MAGDETHGYDLVIEFAEHAIQDLLQTIFDNGLLAAILDALPGVGSDAADVFTIDVRFDRPTDVSIPASARLTPSTSACCSETREMAGACASSSASTSTTAATTTTSA